MAEPLNATFFTLKHRERAVLLPASILVVVVLALIIGLFIAINWGALVDLVRIVQQASPSQDQAESMRIVGRIFGLVGMVFLFLFPLYLVWATYEAACLRWMIRGETPGVLGLTIDADTWRVYGIYWCWFLGQMAVSTAASFVIVPIMMATMFNAVSASDPTAMIRTQLSVQIPLTLVQYILLIFLGARFAPAAAASIAIRQFVFFRAWRVTQGRFWPLLGSFALVWFITAVVFAGVAFAGAIGVFGYVLANWRSADGAQGQAIAEKIFSPTGLALFALCYGLCMIVSLGLALMNFGINARAAIAAVEEGKIAPEATKPSASAAS